MRGITLAELLTCQLLWTARPALTYRLSDSSVVVVPRTLRDAFENNGVRKTHRHFYLTEQ